MVQGPPPKPPISLGRARATIELFSTHSAWPADGVEVRLRRQVAAGRIEVVRLDPRVRDRDARDRGKLALEVAHLDVLEEHVGAVADEETAVRDDEAIENDRARAVEHADGRAAIRRRPGEDEARDHASLAEAGCS